MRGRIPCHTFSCFKRAVYCVNCFFDIDNLPFANTLRFDFGNTKNTDNIFYNFCDNSDNFIRAHVDGNDDSTFHI